MFVVISTVFGLLTIARTRVQDSYQLPIWLTGIAAVLAHRQLSNVSSLIIFCYGIQPYLGRRDRHMFFFMFSTSVIISYLCNILNLLLTLFFVS